MKSIMLSVIACLMLIIMCVGFAVPAAASGTAPIAENLELNTFRNTSVYGALSAYDPEGDVISFEITTKPVKGEIKLEESGTFVYTPVEGKKGRDYFGYKALDSEGNFSQEATVIIKIAKQNKTMEYADMENEKAEYAAVMLSEKGIFTGECIGNKYYFCPDRPVSGAEFTRMCSLVCGEDGIVSDATSEAIAKEKATIILNDALNLNDVKYIDTERPEVQACINLYSVGICNDIAASEEILTRETAAIMLAKAIEIIEKR